MTNAESAQKVVEGYRIPKSRNCPDEIYELMLKCWNQDPGICGSFNLIQ